MLYEVITVAMVPSSHPLTAAAVLSGLLGWSLDALVAGADVAWRARTAAAMATVITSYSIHYTKLYDLGIIRNVSMISAHSTFVTTRHIRT